MRISWAILAIALMFWPTTVFSEQASDEDKVKILVVTGGGNYEVSYSRVFMGYDDFDWTLATSDEEAFKEDIRPLYDVVVMYNLSRSMSEAAQTHLKNFLEADKGLIVWHHALGSYNSWEWWYRDVVGGKYLMSPEGDMPKSTYRQNEEMVISIKEQHPITQRLGPFSFHMVDETYKGLWLSEDNQVLLETGSSTSDGPICWISSYSKSRVVVVQPGHTSGAHLNLAFRFLMRDSILWAASRI